jgi:hypothetical protein
MSRIVGDMDEPRLVGWPPSSRGCLTLTQADIHKAETIPKRLYWLGPVDSEHSSTMYAQHTCP